jgi:hypothetical protein
VVGVAEVGEGGGFFVAVAEVPHQVEGVLVAGDGLGVVAEVVVGVAEAVPGGGLPVAVVEVLVQGEGLLAVGEGLLVVAEQGVVPADRVEGLGLPALVAGVAVGCGAGGHDRQRQWQPHAAGDDLLYRLRLGGHPISTEAASQQLPRGH